MRLPLAAWLLLGIVLPSTAALAGEAPPEFAKKPTAVAEGSKVHIEFAVSRATDVSVGIEDSKGRVVRHLAAGLLGAKAPAPLAAGKLEQSLLWDRRDDLGRELDAAAGPFTVRVRLGLRPEFERIITCGQTELGGIRGLACAPDGNLFVFHTYGSTHPGDGSTVCAVFSRDGKYLRTIIPYPAELPDEKLKGLKRLELPGGLKVPYISQVETRSFIRGLGEMASQRPVVTSDGRLAFVGIQEGPRPFMQAGEARLTVVGTDGSVPAEPLGTQLAALTDVAPSLALSPDEKTLYAAGVRVGLHPMGPDAIFICDTCDHGGATWKHTLPTGFVYKFAWGDLHAQPFNKDKMLKDPVSVATDKDGNVYVADAGDDRIVVFRPDGTYLDKVSIDAPQRVEVRKATGEIYVLSGTKDLELVKLDGYKRGRRLARLTVFESKDEFTPNRRPCMALDETSDPPAVWISRPISRVVDLGRKFAAPVPLIAPPAAQPADDRPRSLGPVMDISLDRSRERLAINNYWLYEPERDAWRRLPMPKELKNWGPGWSPGNTNGAFGLDGNYYVDQGARMALIHRFDNSLKPLPFSAPLPPGVSNEKDREGKLVGFARDHGCGVTADAFGNVYVIWKKAGTDPADAQRAHSLYAYDSNGFPRRDGPLVDCEVPGIYSVRTDYAGNIYLAAALRPGKPQLPPGLEGRLPDGPRDPDSVNGVNGYPLIYGSIVKFSPAGGTIRTGAGGVACNYAHGTPIDVRGAEWLAPGASCVASWAAPKKTPGTVIICMCETPGLDVDGWGRSFYADAGRFRVGVLDTAGNEICTFGAYGNQDSSGPAIAFAWPQAVAVGDRWAYIGDRLNRRIVRVKLSAAAEASCPAP